MINSRSIDDLLPLVRRRAAAFLAECQRRGVRVLITSTYRDNESQAELYAQGRTKPGKRVTNAGPGDSWHNYRCAFDFVPLRGTEPVWNTAGEDGKLWQTVGEIGEACGLEWGGRWQFIDRPHLQFTGGLTLAQLKAGATIEE